MPNTEQLYGAASSILWWTDLNEEIESQKGVIPSLFRAWSVPLSVYAAYMRCPVLTWRIALPGSR